MRRTKEELDRWADLSTGQLAAERQADRTPPDGHHGLPTSDLPANVRRLPATAPANPKLGELFDALSSYLHLDEDGHVLFTLAVAIGAQLDGPPLWGMLVGSSSGGKTEDIHMVSGVANERVDELTAAGLLSWTKGKNARPTGILTRIGQANRGFVTVNDFSTVLAGSDRGGRDQLFALLRVVHDGAVRRDLGNAPEPLTWQGRLTLLAACTPAIDHYSSHADALGPRWLYWRLPSRDAAAKAATGRKTCQVSALAAHRAKVADLAARIVADAVPTAKTVALESQLTDALVDVAVVAGYGRAAIPRSGYGCREIEGMPSIEDPPRLVNQLVLLARCLFALGLDTSKALDMCTQAALHSIPQQRLAVLRALVQADESELAVSTIARRAGCTRQIARFALEELECVGVTTGPDDDETPSPSRVFAPSLWRLDGPNADRVRFVLEDEHMHWCEK